MRLGFDSAGHTEPGLDAIAFRVDLEQWPNYRCTHVHLAYRLDINEFRGLRKVQLVVEHLEAI
jgi:single-stranded-DNA-specific exonuclease